MDAPSFINQGNNMKIIQSKSFKIGALGLALSSLGYSQNAAPSSWMYFNDEAKCSTGDMMTIEVRAPQNPNVVNTYYSALNFNQGQIGGGYGGIQWSSDGGLLFIYSIWDTQSANPSVEYTAPGKMTSESFGGEGTGMKTWSSDKRGVDFDWEWDKWNRLVTRAWNCKGGTCYGFWAYRYGDQKWHHLSRLKVGTPNRGFHNSNGSFLEDWAGTGQSRREAHYRSAWKRSQSSQEWCEYNAPRYSVNSTDIASGGRSYNYRNSWDAGRRTDSQDGKDYWFMQAGGSAISPHTTQTGNYLPNISEGTALPSVAKGEIKQWDVSNNSNNVSVSWTMDSTKAPQFSVHTAIYSGATATGTPISSMADSIPEQTSHTLNTGTLANGQYTVQIKYYDLFDRETIYTQALNVGNTSSSQLSSNQVTSSNIQLSSSLALSSSELASSASQDICSGIADWEAKTYDWSGSKEYVVYDSKLYSHTNWVDATTPNQNSSWTLEGNCSTQSVSSSVESSSSLQVSSSEVIVNTTPIKTQKVSLSAFEIELQISRTKLTTISLMDITGKLILEKQINPALGQKIQLNKALEQGVYFVRIRNNSSSEIHQAIVR